MLLFNMLFSSASTTDRIERYAMTHQLKKSRMFLLLIMLCMVMVWISGLPQRIAKYLPSAAHEKTASQHIDWHSVEVDEVRVYKSRRQLQLLQHGQTIKTYAIRLGFAPIGHKQQEGDGKTPEGRYLLDWHNPASQFYRSIHISYPNAADLQNAQTRGVSPGGNVMIHGSMKTFGGNRGQPLYEYLPQQDWTLGCIAVSNQDMDEIYQQVKDGTPIEIRP